MLFPTIFFFSSLSHSGILEMKCRQSSKPGLLRKTNPRFGKKSEQDSTSYSLEHGALEEASQVTSPPYSCPFSSSWVDFLLGSRRGKNKSIENKANCLLNVKPFPSAQSSGTEALGNRGGWTICGPVNCLRSLGKGKRMGKRHGDTGLHPGTWRCCCVSFYQS